MKRIVKMCLLVLCMLWACLLPLQTQADEVDLSRVPVLSVDEDGNTYFTGETQDLSVRHPQIPDLGGVSTYTLGEMREDGETYLTFTTFEDLKELASWSYEEETAAYYKGDGPLTISEDLVIPENLYTYVETSWQEESTVVVPQGVTLTVLSGIYTPSLEVNGTVVLGGLNDLRYAHMEVCVLTVNGRIVHGDNCTISLGYYSDNVKFTVSDSGSYEGRGYIYLTEKFGTYNSEEEVRDACFVGLELANFDLCSHYTWENKTDKDNVQTWEQWCFRNNQGLTKLDAPTDLQWDRFVYEDIQFDEAGTISFKTGETHQDEWNISIYRVEDNAEIYNGYWNYSAWTGVYRSQNSWHLGIFYQTVELESGTYYFTVQAVGDYVEYCNSDVVKSDNWTYIEPEEKLETPTNLLRNGTTFTWSGTENAGYYTTQMCYAATEEVEKPWYVYNGRSGKDCQETIQSEWAWRYGAGYYYFSVCAVSQDISQTQHSDWSEELVFYYDPAEGVADSLTNIAATAETPEDIKSAVQALDTDQLKNAMAADTDNTGTMDLISKLEEKVGGAADVTVSEDVPAFAADKVSIVGANLNTTSTDGDVTLNIGKPEKEHVLGTLYNSALAVSFSMDLENIEDTENLQVPVKITLPIPSNINPSFLVLLHYHADDTVERIVPHITYQDGQAYASFILTSFSDFVMTQENEPEVNRIAGSGRWDTAIKVADELKATLGVEKFSSIIVASGNDFADALAGSYLSTQKSAPILLSWGKGGKYASLDTDNINYIRSNLAEGGTVYILGGTSAVPSSYEADLSGIKVERLAGGNRYETNLAILKEAGVADGSEILVCTGVTFADSLSAAATGKPILLVQEYNGKVYGIDAAFLNGHNYNFTIIGGTKAVSENLVKKLAAYGNTYRLAGGNRFETSVMVAQRYFDSPDTVVLAYAWNYPDGLCGGALAYAMNAPLILTMDNYESAAAQYVQSGGIFSGYVLGGSNLISDATVDNIFTRN